MRYISGFYALNIPCLLDTTGDWHQSSLDWSKVCFLDSEKSSFGEWGIEKEVYVPILKGRYNVANHLRACADFLDLGEYRFASGMRQDYIANDYYIIELFQHIYLLKKRKSKEEWQKISEVMKKEYMLYWKYFLEKKEEEGNNG